MLDPLTHTVCMNFECDGTNFCESQLGLFAKNTTAFIQKSLNEVVKEYIFPVKEADPCNLFITAVDTFYEKIKGYVIIDSLTPIPECISCIFQRSIHVKKGLEGFIAKMESIKDTAKIDDTMEYNEDEKIGRNIIIIISGAAFTLLGIKMSGEGRLRYWSKRAIIGVGIYHMISSILDLMSMAAQNTATKTHM